MSVHTNEFLPEPLPADPMPLFAHWVDDARSRAVQPNPDAMALATVAADGQPAVRIVLAKQLVTDPGYVVFYTNYQSHKGRQVELARSAAAVLHWDPLHRQVRLCGPVVRSPATESDAYFASRPLASRIGAWASRQSEPLPSRSALLEQIATVRRRFGIADTADSGEIPRPPHWGGYRLWIARLELWVEGPGRVHDRALWTREVRAGEADTFVTSAWTATRLNP
jgi:pyridoxamine 5'-phosphate oxidase